MSKFKASNGKYMSKQLFWEEWITLPLEQRVLDAPFTLHKDKPGRINFGRAYVESRDPTGYKVTQELLGDYNHWQVLMGCRWFVAAKEIWDKELDAALASEAMLEIQNIMRTAPNQAQRLAAAKYLANKEYRKDKTASKGRPKREDIDRAAKDLAASERDLEEDLRRIQGSLR